MPSLATLDQDPLLLVTRQKKRGEREREGERDMFIGENSIVRSFEINEIDSSRTYVPVEEERVLLSGSPGCDRAKLGQHLRADYRSIPRLIWSIDESPTVYCRRW
jgi:hypothetical protein